MSEASNIGILGIGVYLPELVRGNDWWPQEIVDGWAAKAADKSSNPAELPPDGPVSRIAQEIAGDPFGGAKLRHVMAEGETTTDMEVEAGRRALQAAGVEKQDIDLFIVCSWVADLQGTNAACSAHYTLGLPAESLCFSIDSNFNGFHHQVTLAQSLIAAGTARNALIVQSASVSRMMDWGNLYSPWFGDGATALVLGSVKPGFGLLGRAHRTGGHLQGGLLVGVPGGRWFDEGRSVLHSQVPARQQDVLASVCSASHDVIHSALGEAKLGVDDVDYYAGHQGTWWYRRVTHENAGLTRAKAIDTFETNGSMAACNCPLIMHRGLEAGMIGEGDIVLTHAGGNGSTWSALVMRWGGRS